MCGRARCTLSPAQAARAFGFPTTSAARGVGGGGGAGGGDTPAVPMLQMDRFRPSYNVSPGAYLPVGALRARAVGDNGEGGGEEHVPVIQCMKWGLVPSFTSKTEKPDHFRMFNARSESIKEKASFRRLVPKNRCLVAVEGFYEWKKDGLKKQPYYIHFQDQRPLVFAALFDTWINSEGETLHTFTILTTRSSTPLKWLHGDSNMTLVLQFNEEKWMMPHYDRMPVILGDKDSVNAWLNNGSLNLEEISVPYEGADLVWYPVTTAIGKISFNGADCVKEVHGEKPISEFFTRKSAAYDQSAKPEKTLREFADTQVFRVAKETCNVSRENQLDKTYQEQAEENQDASSMVKNEPATLEPQTLYKSQSIKNEDVILPDDAVQKQDPFGNKRKAEETGSNAEMKMENSVPMKKKGKGPKAASHGQASILSFFSKQPPRAGYNPYSKYRVAT